MADGSIRTDLIKKNLYKFCLSLYPRWIANRQVYCPKCQKSPPQDSMYQKVRKLDRQGFHTLKNASSLKISVLQIVLILHQKSSVHSMHSVYIPTFQKPVTAYRRISTINYNTTKIKKKVLRMYCIPFVLCFLINCVLLL